MRIIFSNEKRGKYIKFYCVNKQMEEKVNYFISNG